jgi:EF hand
MRILTGLILTVGFLVAASLGVAQRQAPAPERRPTATDGDDLVVRMMEFDTDKDGNLTKVEITDARLHRLFDRADANKDGIVTKEELASLAAKEQPNKPRGGAPGFGGGPSGFGPRGGPPGGFTMGGGRPGEILPRMIQERLNLTPEQMTELADLQKEVDAKLDKILSAEQKTQLKEMRQRGPGGFGPRGPGGPPGGRRFGGPPPGGGSPPLPPDEL